MKKILSIALAGVLAFLPVFGIALALEPPNGGSETPSIFCPDGQVAVGITELLDSGLDYFRLGCAQPSVNLATNITIAINNNPANGTNFTFSSDLGAFTLDDAIPDDGDSFLDSISFEVTPSVSYKFVEHPLIFWNLDSIVCVYSSVETEVNFILQIGKLVGLTIGPALDDEVICTFHNERGPVTDIFLPIVSKTTMSP